MAGRPRPFPEGTFEKVQAFLKRVRTVGQHKRVLAVWLRASLGLNSEQVATALGWTAGHVRRFRGEYLRQGEAVFRSKGRGGDRRSQLGRQAKWELFEDLAYLRREHNLRLTVRGIKAEVEELLGHPISRAMAYRMIARHGWQASELDRELPASHS